MAPLPGALGPPEWADDALHDLELYAELDAEAADRAAAIGSPLERVHRRRAAAMREAADRFRARHGHYLSSPAWAGA